ncbi:MAG: alpha/beta hydrolase [Myxococcota bacterium]
MIQRLHRGWLAAGLRLRPARSLDRLARAFFRVRGGRASPEEREVLAAGTPARLRIGPHDVAVRVFGAGPVVLLAHGWNGHAGQLAPLVEPLVRDGHRVVAFDFPGHGDSSGTHLTVTEMAEGVEAVARWAGEIRAVVAHSLGSVAVARAVDRGLRVDRLVFLAPAVAPRQWVRAVAKLSGLPNSWRPAFEQAVERRAGAPLDDVDLRVLGPRMHVPLLVVHDAADRYVPASQIHSLLRAWPRSTQMRTSGLGHFRVLRDDRVIAAVRQFVAPGSSSASSRYPTVHG